MAEVSAEALDAAKAKVGKPAKHTLAAVRSFTERAEALLATPATLRANVRHQVAVLTDQRVQAELQRRPVAELRDLVGRGARLNTVAEAGFASVAQILASGPQRIQAVPGIGPQTAQQVVGAAQRFAAQVTEQTQFRFDPDRKDPAQAQLLATLMALRHADSAVTTLEPQLRQLTAQTAPLVSDAEPTTSRPSMLFRGSAKKHAALTALAQLDAVLADPRVASLHRTLESQERATDPSSYPEWQAWDEYTSDAASFNALLSTLGGAGEGDDTEAAQGFIPAELRQEISAVPLDTGLLTATLRGYQAFGAQYAIHQKFSILGDEMGLGKTVESLAVLAHLAARGQRRFLVVCPASVLANWTNEIAKHSRLTAHTLHGSGRDATTRTWLRDGGVAVTTFDTLGRLDGITEADVAMMVVDEAHLAKNPTTKRSQAVAEAVNHSQRAMFLTGTPMENRVEEFRNLVSYLQPAIAKGIDATDAVAGAKRFRRAVAPVYLRRNQEDVLTELPDKIEVEDWVYFTPADNAAYNATVQSRNLMQMRQAAFHAENSAKLERLAEIADEACEDGLKMVVFSNFLHVLDRIGNQLGSRAMGPITGSVPPQVRQQIVDEFARRDGHAVLLLQIEAGGQGLNIQAASIVVIAEPQWKPSTEEQAVARAYRMGQVRKVQVHRLLAKGSVDERLREVQEEKSLLFAEFARRSEAKEADARAVDTREHRPDSLDDNAVPLEQRIVMAEQHRLGIS
ncbi:DEAD/DEAH box helicase [Prauserella alba]|nr:SNF2-related protein [Prauserella alba]